MLHCTRAQQPHIIPSFNRLFVILASWYTVLVCMSAKLKWVLIIVQEVKVKKLEVALLTLLSGDAGGWV